MDNFSKKQFKDALFYANDVLLGNINTFSEPVPVPGRPCQKQLVTLNHMPYNAYHFEDHTLLVPSFMENGIDGVIDFGGTEGEFHYSVFSKKDGTMEYINYNFNVVPLIGVKFMKYTMQCSVSEADWKKLYEGIHSEEQFFGDKSYLYFFQQDPNATLRIVDVLRNGEETKAYSNQVQVHNQPQIVASSNQYTPVSNPEASLFEIADTFDNQSHK